MKPAMTEAPNSPSVYRGGARRAGGVTNGVRRGEDGVGLPLHPYIARPGAAVGVTHADVTPLLGEG